MKKVIDVPKRKTTGAAVKPSAKVAIHKMPTGVRGLDEIVGGSPYGATTIAGSSGERQPSELDLAGAKHQGELIGQTAKKLCA